MTDTCTINSDGCFVCTGQPYIPPTPGHLNVGPMPGWNAGANSVVELNGDVIATLSSQPMVAGAMFGLRTTRVGPSIIATYPLAFYFTHNLYAIAVSGTLVSAEYTRDSGLDETFALIRSGGFLHAQVNGTTIYTCAAPAGAMVVSGAEYNSGDTIGPFTFEPYIGTSGRVAGTLLPMLLDTLGTTLRMFGRPPRMTLAVPTAVRMKPQRMVGFIGQVGPPWVRATPLRSLIVAGNTFVPLYTQMIGAPPPMKAANTSAYFTVYGDEDGTPPRMRLNAGTAVNRMYSQPRAMYGWRITDAVPPTSYFALLAPQPRVLMMGSSTIVVLTGDAAVGHDAAVAQLTIQVLEAVRVQGASSSTLTGANTINETVLAQDAPFAILLLIADAAAVADDDPEAFLNILLDAADLVLASGAVGSLLEAYVAVAALAELTDLAQPIVNIGVDDALAALDAAAMQRIAMIAMAMDAVAATDAVDNTIRIVLLADDGAGFSDEAATTLQGFLDAMDTGVVAGHVRLGADEYTLYAMTIQGAAPSQYTYSCNSIATIAGHMYGATENGLLLLEGDTDLGVDIDAHVRVGLSALGTQLMKAVPNAYVGYTSDGALLFKVSTTSAGVKRTNVYQLNPVPKTTVSNNRFTISKGLHSVYWDFEIANLDGADFELETIKVWRMALNRRK